MQALGARRGLDVEVLSQRHPQLRVRRNACCRWPSAACSRIRLEHASSHVGSAITSRASTPIACAFSPRSWWTLAN